MRTIVRTGSWGSLSVAGLLSAVLAAPLPAAAAIDIHGAWLIRTGGATSEIVDVAQAGDAISFVYRGLLVSGTLSATGRLQLAGDDGSFFLQLDGDVSSDGQLLNVSVLSFQSSTLGVSLGIGMRCACVDGNAANGDGCDDECQVEPCWTCTGTPSACVPAGDGTACEDGDVCTTGSTCTGGTCAGGSPMVPCVDPTGSWNVHAVKVDPYFGQPPLEVDFTRMIRARNGHILVRDSPNREYFGDADVTTGAISWTKTAGFYGFGLCGTETAAAREPYAGAVSPGGATLDTAGVEYYQVTRCPFDRAVTEHGTRPECPDGTPCSTGNPCVTGETCSGDVCQGGTPVTCGPCESCQPSTGCTATPEPTCTGPTRPAMLAIRNVADDPRDRISWRWQSTATGPLGNPLASEGVTLCLFDLGTATPTLLFRSAVPGGGTCGSRPCWRGARVGTGFVYSDRAAANQGTRTMRLLSAAPQGSHVRFGGKGTQLSGRPFGLPSVPVPETLLLQLQTDGGACFEARYTPAGVRTNNAARGKFRARSE